MAQRTSVPEDPLDVLIRPSVDSSSILAAGTPAGRTTSPVTEEQAAATEVYSLDSRLDQQYLTFFLAGEEYGAAILDLREVVEYRALSTVPRTPPWIRGAMNLRGEVLTVVDLATRFELGQTTLSPRTCIIVVELDPERSLQSAAGVVVDSVHRVLDLRREQLLPAPEFGTRVVADFLKGMAAVDDRLVSILDLRQILSRPDLLKTSSPSSRPGEEQRDGEARELDHELEPDSPGPATADGESETSAAPEETVATDEAEG